MSAQLFRRLVVDVTSGIKNLKLGEPESFDKQQQFDQQAMSKRSAELCINATPGRIRKATSADGFRVSWANDLAVRRDQQITWLLPLSQNQLQAGDTGGEISINLSMPQPCKAAKAQGHSQNALFETCKILQGKEPTSVLNHAGHGGYPVRLFRDFTEESAGIPLLLA